EAGNVRVLLANAKANRGVLMTYAKKELPYLTLWKNTGAEADGYVIGIEPGSSFPNRRKVERDAGRVPSLAGNGRHTMRMDFSLLDAGHWVGQTIDHIAEVQKGKAATVSAEP